VHGHAGGNRLGHERILQRNMADSQPMRRHWEIVSPAERFLRLTLAVGLPHRLKQGMSPLEREVEQANLARFGGAPRMHRFSPDPIAKDRLALDQVNGKTSTSQHDREGGSCHPAADDRDVGRRAGNGR
jgi:hypothetical protein